jgi:hypothetical protein
MYTKCTNKTCPNEHDILKSTHNKRIINARDLSFIPTGMLQAVIRASADPSRSVMMIYYLRMFIISFSLVSVALGMH